MLAKKVCPNCDGKIKTLSKRFSNAYYPAGDYDIDSFCLDCSWDDMTPLDLKKEPHEEDIIHVDHTHDAFWVYRKGVYVPDDRAIKRYREKTGILLRELKAAHPMRSIESCLHPNFINLKNCIYDIKKRRTFKHTPEFISLIQLPVHYNPNATCPKIDDFFHEAVHGSEDAIRLLHEWLGVAMLQKIVVPKICVLVEWTEVRTRIFLELLSPFLGHKHVSAYNNISTAPWLRAGLQLQLAGRRRPDEFTKKYLATWIKRIAAGEEISAQRKSKRFRFKPVATLFYAYMTNKLSAREIKKEPVSLLRFKETPNDFYWIFSKEFEERLTPQELSGLLNHALAGMHRVLDNGDFTT